MSDEGANQKAAARARGEERAVTDLRAFGVTGVGEVRAGDDLAAVLLAGLASGFGGSGGSGDDGPGQLQAGDVLVVSSKVVSKAEGRFVAAASRADLDDSDLVAKESVRLVARRRTPFGLAKVVEAAAGPVMAAAGVDASNVEPGQALLLPVDPDRSARELRSRLDLLGAPRIGVVLSDTAGRAWRDGQIDFALGVAGVQVVDDLRGTTDEHGNPLEVTVRALVDEIASLADLVKGKLSGMPAVVVRGLSGLVTDDDGPGAAALLRTARQDWFRLGHVEAVRAALGVDPELHEPPSVSRERVAARLARALEVALAAPDPWDGKVIPGWGLSEPDLLPDGGCRVTVDLPGTVEETRLGALAQRIAATAWSEDLAVTISRGRTSDRTSDRTGDRGRTSLLIEAEDRWPA